MDVKTPGLCKVTTGKSDFAKVLVKTQGSLAAILPRGYNIVPWTPPFVWESARSHRRRGMDEVKALVGGDMMHGGGTDPDLFDMRLELEPDFVATDAGSADPGPAFLGSGKAMTHKQGIKQSMEVMLKGCLKQGIPLLIGSAGIGGNRPHLEYFRDIVEEIAEEEGLHFRLGLIDSEQDEDYLNDKLREGKTRPLGSVPPALTEGDIDRATHIVGMMGAEPWQKALEMGAQVVIGGRSSDSALFAAVPMMRGFPAAQSWHMAKTIECGAMVSEPVPGVRTGIMARVRGDHFLVEPSHPNGVCTTLRVAAHTLYENPSPYYLYEPAGMIDTSQCTFEQETPRVVKVLGSAFVPAEKYTIKLEGAEQVGYRTITIAGTRDPDLIDQVDSFLEMVKRAVGRQAANQGFSPDSYNLFFRVYGKGAVMREWEPEHEATPLEAGIIGECIAPTQETASAIMNMAHGAILHTPYEGRLCSSGNMAFPYSPHDIEMGPVYRFNIWHVVEPSDPMEMFNVAMAEI